MSTQPTKTPRSALLAMCATAGMVLVVQIGLTRILSATLVYHFAFAVIAVVMLGLAASAARVFIDVARDGEVVLGRCARYLEVTALLLAVAGLSYPHLGQLGWEGDEMFAQLGVTMVVFTAVFYLSGYVIAALLTEYKSDVGRVYWADLMGAALGCLLVVPLLGLVSALDLIVQCGAVALLAAFALHKLAGTTSRRAFLPLVGVPVLLFGTLLLPGLTELRFAKGQSQDDVVWERWNHLARVTVSTDMPGTRESLARLSDEGAEADARALVNSWAAGWGMSSAFEGTAPEIRWIALDSGAGTQIIKDGARDPSAQHFLAWDITSVGYHLNPGGLEDVFVIGGGGGRDVLTALHLGAHSVDVVELNPLVVQAVDEQFGDFSGRVYSHPKVNTVVDEARSVLSRSDKNYDLIQMSMIDTWAATMAGSLALAENVLYTLEAYDLFVSRLNDDGILSVSRWFTPDYPGELIRVLGLMGASLSAVGVENVADHVVVLYTRGTMGTGVATCLLKPTPFDESQISALREIADRMRYDVLWPVDGRDDIVAALQGEAGVLGGPEFDHGTPTDDRPFFFNLLKPVGSWWVALQEGDSSKGSRPFAMLVMILIAVALASYAFVLRPLLGYNASKPDEEKLRVRDNLWACAYFGGIGLGFMGVELGLIQRTIVFLGHPTYSLSVVLFTLLLFTGIGSAISSRLSPHSVPRVIGGIFVGLLFVTMAAPPIFEAVHHIDRSARIGVAIAVVAPLATLMGMLLPMGMRRLIDAGKPQLVPWMWAVNGVFGVVATVLAMFVAMSFGYTMLIVAAGFAYLMTFAASLPSARW